VPGGGEAEAGGALGGIVEVDDGVEVLGSSEGAACAGEVVLCVLDVGSGCAKAGDDVAAVEDEVCFGCEEVVEDGFGDAAPAFLVFAGDRRCVAGAGWVPEVARDGAAASVVVDVGPCFCGVVGVVET
jgi:hypothetical protein